jgi:hypothetical protein
MRQDVKEKWIAALNSGKYYQITGLLATDDGGRCALGVLADLAAAAGVVVQGTRRRGDGVRDCLAYDGLVFSLPAVVLKWADLTAKDADDVLDMNEDGVSFSLIAAWIKKFL